ncbi:unnamed protein product [Lepeophtheirus salmonis]|nr:unnamed protein product [Lepeophtheirus salmonis]CAF3039502.1 unnamed protein product [Lepeophtheirus salmonis]
MITYHVFFSFLLLFIFFNENEAQTYPGPKNSSKFFQAPNNDVSLFIINADTNWMTGLINKKYRLRNASIEEIIIHSNFYIAEDFQISSDIALIKINNDFSKILPLQRLPRIFMPICLPMRKSKYIGKIATVIGWGLQDPDNELSVSTDHLMQTNVQVISNYDKKCKHIATVGISGGYNSSKICAYDAKQDACRGDSGGPLMLKTKWPEIEINGTLIQIRYIILGVVSYGVECGNPIFAGVYTRITGFAEWIYKHSKTGNC